ncbi:MAG: hypothetical protein A3H32_03250 [Betaproteobacteria bacterium RIFCSPLOWO2_02_FULL_63_19]|nr:MAG: hypothetical protein A3H32_03250 [Betaproteobacteria bacterium RIFCSPLOWO2_02_FULL_63_19]
MGGEHRSIRKLLGRWLIWPLIALAALSAWSAYLTAVRAARDAYDSALLDPALAIASQLRRDREGNIEIGLSKIALEALRVDSVDRMYFQVMGRSGRRIAGTAHIALPPNMYPELAYDHNYYDSVIEGRRVRVAVLGVPRSGGRVLVQVAETVEKRDRLVRDLLLSTLIPEAIFFLLAMLMLGYGILRGLKPLERLREEIDSRSAADLHPVNENDTPKEIRSLVRTLNNLFNRLDGAIDRQRRFIANAAHQLRTPLAGLKTHAELARDEANPNEIRALLDIIAGETERATRLVNQLLALARAEPGVGHTPCRNPINLRELVDHATHFWIPRALAKDIDLGFDMGDAWIDGDATLLRELLGNLLDNAIAYTDSGGAITFRTYTHGSKSILEVEDNGRGIPESERARVFERFYRIRGTGGEGCGLGLSIVAEIADRHAASVEIKDASSGTGTCVRVVFNSMQETVMQA